MSRRLVITDIHGCFHSLRQLLEQKLQLKKHDTLYLLGDYVNKGPFSKEVLDYLMQLQERGYKLYLLRGNHEQELLNCIDGKTDLDRLMSKGVKSLLKSFGIRHPQELPRLYIDFMRSLRYFFELPEFYLVHAGFNFEKENPFLESEEMFTIRDYTVDLTKTGGKRIIHGHSPTALQEILRSLEESSTLHYSLDAGCAYRDNPRQAHLLALNLNTWEVYCQPNIDDSPNYA
ncbi:metallophosphoesterase family protein [Nafulsella turpanensis]|uniref:metallophosphoesterase family protein n=1 Tax=Nafulsella turpanensis TaxID=1265690 RepID=UPI0003459916|nr:metallophosphoesterase family protein [Nafulsella turpanensis]